MKILQIAAVALISVFPVSLSAEMLKAPAGDVLLSVSGDIEHKTSDAAAQFDLSALSALPATTFETSTIWTEGVQEFTGVSLHTLLETVGVSGDRLLASAINDYQVEIPVSDATEGGPIVAYMRNGAEMSLRNKGPLWIVYPYDLNADYQTETIYSRSIWQLDRIEVVK